AFAIWCIGPGLFAFKGSGDSSLGPFDKAGAFHDVLTALLQASIIAFTSRWLILRAVSDRPRSPTWQLAALLLTAGELAIANAWLVATAPADLWRHEPPIAQPIHEAATKADTTARPVPRVFRG